ncbi:hypothetical protein RRG08_045386 [Elysia crispata]|uniref:DDE-1 domain-containing protein n=1 Tax=Elysia crispata TaxID=231223 RepID=A0AAE0YAU1_9GAST|nr:hypothetical protein RRG08_045386 [Elysia crispata]
MTIGHSSNPRFFKNVKKLPLEYLANKKAWITSAVFEKWIRKLDTSVEGLKAIRLVFLPPNTTSKLQPCDQGISSPLNTASEDTF